jgi:hypothetical protein
MTLPLTAVEETGHLALHTLPVLLPQLDYAPVNPFLLRRHYQPTSMIKIKGIIAKSLFF